MTTLRLAVGQTKTERRHVEEAWAVLRREAAGLGALGPPAPSMTGLPIDGTPRATPARAARNLLLPKAKAARQESD